MGWLFPFPRWDLDGDILGRSAVARHGAVWSPRNSPHPLRNGQRRPNRLLSERYCRGEEPGAWLSEVVFGMLM